MGLYLPSVEARSAVQRVQRTVALLERRGYALPAPQLGQLCLGGRLTDSEVRQALAATPFVVERGGLVMSRSSQLSLTAIVARRCSNDEAAAPTWASTLRFTRLLAGLCPHLLSVAVAGSLASGGFRETDDVDLNLVVEDGSRHLAYVVLNGLGLVHALHHRSKPVDVHTRRPLAPRLMTANLILERSECFPLARQDEDMAYELLLAEPVLGADLYREVIDANPDLLEHFPQLAGKRALRAVGAGGRRLPGWALPRRLEAPARRLARAGWRYMQWTRRHRPEALAHVAFVRASMRPYVLFPDL